MTTVSLRGKRCPHELISDKLEMELGLRRIDIREEKMAPAVACIDVVGDLCPNLVCRVLGLVAQHNVVPSHVLMKTHKDQIHLSIWVVGVPDLRARTAVRKIQSFISVRSATIS